jgi:hypothetical protein
VIAVKGGSTLSKTQTADSRLDSIRMDFRSLELFLLWQFLNSNSYDYLARSFIGLHPFMGSSDLF